MKKYSYLFIIGVLSLTPFIVSAAWGATDNFDTYSPGTSINGANGGIGWSGGWNLLNGSSTINIAPSGGQGGLAVQSQGNQSSITRTRSTPGPDGYVHFKVRMNNNHYAGVYFTDSGGGGVNSNRFGINLNNPSGWITATDGQSYNANLVPLNSNTWYDISIKYGHVANKFAVSIDGGPYSGDYSMGGGNTTLIDGISIFTTTGTTDFWVDDIRDDSVVPPPTNPNISGSGTINRLLKFTTSTTTIGDALFSDDGVNTTLTSGNLFLQPNSIFDAISNGVLNFGTQTATTMFFGRTGQNMIINSKVGVGTTNPTSPLEVVGETRTNTLITDSIKTTSNCISITSPAICGSAPSGSVAMATGGSTLQVNTSAITANSQIFVMEDSSLGSRLGITCNTGTNRSYTINNRVASTSFTIKSSNNITGTRACLSYWIVN